MKSKYLLLQQLGYKSISWPILLKLQSHILANLQILPSLEVKKLTLEDYFPKGHGIGPLFFPFMDMYTSFLLSSTLFSKWMEMLYIFIGSNILKQKKKD